MRIKEKKKLEFHGGYTKINEYTVLKKHELGKKKMQSWSHHFFQGFQFPKKALISLEFIYT